MSVLSILTMAIAPGVALLSYFYLKDRYDPEPISQVLKLFLFGMILVFPVMVLQHALLQGLGEDPFVFSFVASSFPEEFFKWFIIYFVIFKHTSFDEPYDGIVYAVAVSLGFATLENVIYAFLSNLHFADLMMRAFLPVSGHAMFGVMMGFHFGKARFTPERTNRHLFYAFALPFFWHGIFDYILLATKSYWVWFMAPLMCFLWLRSLWKVNRANAKSPLGRITREERIKI
ncbi:MULTISPECIES: glutamic-type intramembrane protease PrsW [Paenibacillus]|uniref:Protease PrsW n=1 Tax=Paenibacillus naphthalenovorans TaxID=162209 RepID=A0A0U2VPM4_9BACL|nr:MULTISPECIES: glutamic-type intramembrane protease PrsW [Paenibacillus]ALS22710.1 peptidase [Paenibacillus naphthalenovorans]GCL70505.1 PrsW family intramembrane metalloprotease [Paenibacillus naphthalenovorans]SDH80023.1 Membrane proteinase PrsW, cleaves anti-sigma factor RsiW, M82 family [Paenibacillus naphthalenovorans]